MSNRIDLISVQFNPQARGEKIIVIRQNTRRKYRYTTRRGVLLAALAGVSGWQYQELHFTALRCYSSWTFLEYYPE